MVDDAGGRCRHGTPRAPTFKLLGGGTHITLVDVVQRSTDRNTRRTYNCESVFDAGRLGVEPDPAPDERQHWKTDPWTPLTARPLSFDHESTKSLPRQEKHQEKWKGLVLTATQ